MIGPVVDVELLEPPEKIPPGVVISIKHFLSIPQSVVMRQSIQTHSHQIIKLTKAHHCHEVEVIDVQDDIDSHYLTTDKFAGGHFCKVAATANASECNHSSLTKLIVTKYIGRCSHEPNCLYLFCVCEGAEDRLEGELRDQHHEKTVAVMRTNIDKSPGISYKISVTGETSGEDRVISHEELCKYDGVFMFGGFIKKPFLVSCNCEKSERMHCEDSMLIAMKISRSFGLTSFYKSFWNPTQKYEASLPCSKLEQHARAPTDSVDYYSTIPSDSVTPEISSQRDINHKIDGLLMKKLVQPSDPGLQHQVCFC